MNRSAIRLSFLLLVPLVSSACTLRYAQSSFTDPALDGATKGVSLEAGGYFWDGAIAGQRADVGLMGAYQQFDFFTDAAASHVEARLRWFPLQPTLVDPFLGGGFGVYRLNRTESDQRCRGRGICLADQTDQRGQATGLTPHFVLGAEVRPPSLPGGVVVAAVREFGVFDPEWDLSAWRISVGLVFRPER